MSTRELGKRRVAMATMGLLAVTGVGTGAVAILAGHSTAAAQASKVTSGSTGTSSTGTSSTGSTSSSTSSPSTSSTPASSSTGSTSVATTGGS